MVESAYNHLSWTKVSGPSEIESSTQIDELQSVMNIDMHWNMAHFYWFIDPYVTLVTTLNKYIPFRDVVLIYQQVSLF